MTTIHVKHFAQSDVTTDSGTPRRRCCSSRHLARCGRCCFPCFRTPVLRRETPAPAVGIRQTQRSVKPETRGREEHSQQSAVDGIAIYSVFRVCCFLNLISSNSALLRPRQVAQVDSRLEVLQKQLQQSQSTDIMALNQRLEALERRSQVFFISSLLLCFVLFHRRALFAFTRRTRLQYPNLPAPV